MSGEIKTVYMVKWWRSLGIVKTNAMIKCVGENGKLFATTSGLPGHSFSLGNAFFESEFYLTEEEAQEAVRQKKAKECKAMEKKLAKLRKDMDKPIKVVERGPVEE